MKETIDLDIFDQIPFADAVVFPTNCTIGKDGRNPMGALAGAFARRWPSIPTVYNRLLQILPQVPVILGWLEREQRSPGSFGSWIDQGDPHYFIDAFNNALAHKDWCTLIAFPTMHQIGELADIDLILRSTNHLVEMADTRSWNNVFLPSPGTGAGGLSVALVHGYLKDRLDDRFTVMRKG